MLASMRERIKATKKQLKSSGLAATFHFQKSYDRTHDVQCIRISPVAIYATKPQTRAHKSKNRSKEERPEPPAAMVAQLVDMGFPEDQVKRALIASGNDINRAVEYCMDPDSMPSPSLTSDNSAENSLSPGAMLLNQISRLGSGSDSRESTAIANSNQHAMQLFGGLMGDMMIR